MSYNRFPTPGGGGSSVTSVNGFTGVVVLTTTDIAEGTNLYFTNARAISALSGTLLGYALLAGRAGGQILNGGTAAAESLALRSTANATKGFILLGSNSGYDETNARLGLGTATPGYTLDAVAGAGGGINVQTGDFVPWIGSNLGTLNNMWLENYRGIRLDFKNGTSFLQIFDDVGPGAVQVIGRQSRDLVLTTDDTVAAKGVIVRGAASQTASLLAVQHNDTTVRLSVSTGGNVSMPVAARVGSTGAPVTSAALDVSSTTGALMLPRMTTTEKNALTAANGMLVYDTTLNKFQGYENGSWVSLI